MDLESLVRTVTEGDALEILRQMPSESIDLIATDPPYGISFMLKEWDKLPSVEIWKECLRILKHGAFAFILCTPRLDSLSEECRRLQEAGFIISFSPIFWTYGSGFPKASCASKIIDKRLRAERPIYLAPKEVPISTSMTTEAKKLDGAFLGFQPKPAVEVVIVAMKPLSEKTYVEQALKNGKGITFLDGGRIPYVSEEDRKNAECVQGISGNINFGTVRKQDFNQNSKGRFPANLLVQDDVLNDGTVSKSREVTSEGGFGASRNTYGLYNPDAMIDYRRGFNDSGSFSRYFDLDRWFEERIKKLPKNVRKTFPFLIVPKAAPSERNDGLEELPKGPPPASARSKPAEGRKNALGEWRENFHPTVKPVKLFTYLITIGSREGDIVLDPFLGSGTTAIACEMLSRKWVGIEINKEYADIARGRLRDYIAQDRLDTFTNIEH